mgnify:FL=1|jgi:hypothetical protein|nr:MAG TPA: tail tube protein [Bacteriophage sp.]
MDGLSTIGTILKMGAQSSSLTEVPDLQDFPDLMGAPDKIETTTMKNTSRTYIPGLKDPGDMAFNFLYSGMGEGTNYAKLKAVQDAKSTPYFQLVFPDGSGFAWQGKVSLSVPGKGIGEALQFTANITPTSEIEEIDVSSAG